MEIQNKMARAGDKGTSIEVLAIDGREILLGDRITVRYVENIDTPREKVVEEFTARVLYNSTRTTYFYAREERISAHYEKNIGFFGTRGLKFKILDR